MYYTGINDSFGLKSLASPTPAHKSTQFSLRVDAAAVQISLFPIGQDPAHLRQRLQLPRVRLLPRGERHTHLPIVSLARTLTASRRLSAATIQALTSNEAEDLDKNRYQTSVSVIALGKLKPPGV